MEGRPRRPVRPVRTIRPVGRGADQHPLGWDGYGADRRFRGHQCRADFAPGQITVTASVVLGFQTAH